MQKLLLLLLTILISTTSLISGARILAILPYSGTSHQMFFQAVLRPLAERGHHVVVYSPKPLAKPIDNYIHIPVNCSFFDNFMTYELLEEILNSSHVGKFKQFMFILHLFTEQVFENENIQKLIKSNEHFDLVITETFFGQEAFTAFGHKFNAPTITLQTSSSFCLINKVMGNSLALSYFPDANMPLSDQMTFYDRLKNSYSALFTLSSYYYKHIPAQQALIDRHMNLTNAPPLEDMVHNISMVFTNAHPTLHYPRPFSPNTIQLGGIHVSQNQKLLPNNIKQFMNEAENGVIYFSLGSLVPDHIFPKDIHTSFINVFKKLPQRVLWKTEIENIPGLAKNVMTQKWMPQQEVLNHPNCVLFITHGGMLSMLETIHAGVPVVGIPFYADQGMNVKFYEQKGIGVELAFLNISEETILTSIKTVLSNPQYKLNAKKIARISKDLPMSLSDTAVFWVEYVLRHKGASHLRQASAGLSWYKLALLDVVGVVLASICILLAVIYISCSKLCSILFHRQSKNTDLKKKRQ